MGSKNSLTFLIKGTLSKIKKIDWRKQKPSVHYATQHSTANEDIYIYIYI